MADFVSDEEQVERLRRWWSENGLALIGAVVLAVAGVVGWRWYQDWRAEGAAAAADAYGHYLDARAIGEDTSALFHAIATEHEGSTYHVFALLFEAKDAVAAGDHARAAERLTEGVALAASGVLRDATRVRLARVLDELDRPQDALAELGAVQSGGFADAVAELTGDIHLRQGALGAARGAYQAAFDAAEAPGRREYLELKLRSVPADGLGPGEQAAPDSPPAATAGAGAPAAGDGGPPPSDTAPADAPAVREGGSPPSATAPADAPAASGPAEPPAATAGAGAAPPLAAAPAANAPPNPPAAVVEPPPAAPSQPPPPAADEPAPPDASPSAAQASALEAGAAEQGGSP